MKYTSKGIIIDGQEIFLDEIIKNIKKAEIEEKDLVLMKLKWNFCRNFRGITEFRTMTRKNANIFQEKILNTGIDLQFGEINGNHSDIYDTLDTNDFSIIDDKEEIINFFKEHPNGKYTPEGHSFISTISEQWEDYGWGKETGLSYEEYIELFK